MEKTAANDTVLLAQAQQRVQSMLEDYVKNMGTMLGTMYSKPSIFMQVCVTVGKKLTFA